MLKVVLVSPCLLIARDCVAGSETAQKRHGSASGALRSTFFRKHLLKREAIPAIQKHNMWGSHIRKTGTPICFFSSDFQFAISVKVSNIETHWCADSQMSNFAKLALTPSKN